MDERLLYALRYLREGKLVYGVQGEYTTFLEPYAEELGYDRKMGNLVQTIPIPCELVHEGYSKSCESHALYCPVDGKINCSWRWRRAFQAALMV
jgi:hypothetical protein